MRARHLLIRLLTPLVWSASEKRKLAALQEFSDTELDSGWQSLHALERVEDPRAKAVLFLHALEEFRHADMFAALLGSYSRAPLNHPVFARKAMLADAASRDGLLEFLAQVYVGESEINRDFVAYSRSGVDAPIRELFTRIKKDEEGPEEVGWDLMRRCGDRSAGELRWLVFKKRAAHAWRRYANATQSVGNLWLSVLLGVVYALVGPFAFLPLRARLALDPRSQLDILREQLRPGAGKAAS